jgi:ribosomally synthesized peptide
MSQEHVEWLLGRLTTDRDFRQRFHENPAATCARESLDLTPQELAALLSLEPARIEEFAKRLDPRIVRAATGAERSQSRHTTRTPEPSTPTVRGAK